MPAFYLSCLLAFTGGHMVNYTVILYLQEKVGSDLLAGIGFGLAFGSSIVFGWFAGVVCDRFAPHRVIHGAQALFALCLAGLLWSDLGADAGSRTAWVLASALAGGIAWSFAGPARLAVLGQIAAPERLRPATIVFNLQVLIGFGLAPLAIGLIRSRAEWPAVMLTALACFALSSLLLLGTHTQGRGTPSAGLGRELGAGFAALRRDPLLGQLMVAAIIGYAMTGPLQILLPRLARGVLGLSEVERGAFLGLLAVSLIGGGLLALALARRVHHGRTVFAGIALGGLLFAGLALATRTPLASILLVAVGMGGGLVISLVVAGIQSRAPEVLRGRILAMYSMISQVIPAASGVAAGALLKATGTGTAIAAAGLTLAVLSLAGAILMPTLRRYGGELPYIER